MFDLYQATSEVNQPSAQEIALRARMKEKQQSLMTAQYKAETRTGKKHRLSLIEQIILLLGLGR